MAQELTPKECGHSPNPPDDVDSKGIPYQSCYWCFLIDLDEFEDSIPIPGAPV